MIYKGLPTKNVIFHKLPNIHLPVKGSSNQWETPNEHDELHWLETGGPDLLSEHCHYYLVKTNIAMEKSTIFKFSKPSISMGHLYHGYVK